VSGFGIFCLDKIERSSPWVPAASIWFEIWGVVDPGKKILIF